MRKLLSLENINLCNEEKSKRGKGLTCSKKKKEGRTIKGERAHRGNPADLPFRRFKGDIRGRAGGRNRGGEKTRLGSAKIAYIKKEKGSWNKWRRERGEGGHHVKAAKVGRIPQAMHLEALSWGPGDARKEKEENKNVEGRRRGGSKVLQTAKPR